MRTEVITEAGSRPAELLRQGGLVAVPTETVYGLAANGLDAVAVEKIYAVKGRPEQKALSLMVPGPEALDRYGTEVPPAAYALAERFWPGPLTLVVKARTELIPDIVRAGGDTVALRCPDHPLTLALLRETGLPLAAPSANPSGAPSPGTARAVLDYFDGQIEGVLDGGPCGLGTESTILDLSRTPYRILRQGALPEETLRQAMADSLTIVGITGGTGCGKTTALETLAALGALVIDCDAVYHDLTEHSTAMLAELDARFPGVVENGVLARKKLGERVFADPAALADLGVLTARYVNQAVTDALADWAMQGRRLAAVDAIALIGSGIDEKCLATVGILAPTEIRVQRLMAREGISEAYARLRIDAQQPNSYFEQHCTYTLYNDGSREDFADRCMNLFTQILKTT